MYLFLRKDPLKMEQDVLDPGPESHEGVVYWVWEGSQKGEGGSVEPGVC